MSGSDGLLSRLAQRTGRYSWGIVDQGVCSASNLVLSVVAARALDVVAFGRLAVALSVWLFTIGLVRGCSGEPALVLLPRLGAKELKPVARFLAFRAAKVGGLVGGLLLALAISGVPVLGASAIVVALALPWLAVQDACRYMLIAQGRPAAAAANDVTWLVAQCVGVAWILLAGDATEANLVVIWGVAGSLCGVIGVWQVGLGQRLPSLSKKDSLAVRGLGRRYLGEHLLSTMLAALLVWYAAYMVGAAAAAGLRGANVLFGPLLVASAGISAALIAATAGNHEQPVGRIIRTGRRLSLCLGTVTMLFGGVLLMIPANIGQLILGASWVPSRELLPYLVGSQVLSAVTTGHLVALRSLAAARESLRARALAAPVAFGAPIVLVGVFGMGGIGPAALVTAVATLLAFELSMHQAVVVRSAE